MHANPVMTKELRGRMRGWGAAVVLTIYLIIVSGVALLFYSIFRATSEVIRPESSQVGKFLFGTVVVIQTLMVSLLTPAFTAGAITSEKERKTYDVLMITLLRPRSVILGKLGSALAYVALLIIALAPLQSLSFMFGGVSPEEIILSQVVILLAAVLFASIGIFWSTVVRSSVGSNVLTYGTIMAQLVLLPIVYYTIWSMTTFNSYLASQQVQVSADMWTYIWAYVNQAVQSLQPLVAMFQSEASLLNGDSLFIYDMTVANGHTVKMLSPWLLFCLEALVLSAILVLLSIRLVQPARFKYAAKLQPYQQAYAEAVPATGEMQPQPPNPYQQAYAEAAQQPPAPAPTESRTQMPPPPPPPADPQPNQ